MIKGHFWRSSVKATLRTVLEQSWPTLAEYRIAPLFPVGTKLMEEGDIIAAGGVPTFTLSRDDKRAFEHNPEEHLVRVTTKACIVVMREGYEVRPDPDVPIGVLPGDCGPEDETKLIGSYDEFKKTFGDLVKPKGGGGKKE